MSPNPHTTQCPGDSGKPVWDLSVRSGRYGMSVKRTARLCSLKQGNIHHDLSDRFTDHRMLGDERMLQMLSQVRLAELETWLCTPTPVLPRSRQESRPTYSSAFHYHFGRSAEGKVISRKFLTLPSVPLGSPLPGVLQKAPCEGSAGKRRRLPPIPGDLHWNNTDAWQLGEQTEGLPVSAEEKDSKQQLKWWAHSGKATLRKSISADECLFLRQPERQKTTSKTGKDKSQFRHKHSLYSTDRRDFHHKTNLRLKMTQQMQNLQLTRSKKTSIPSSPNAAKRLYRNLSDKLKGSHSSVGEAFLTEKMDNDRQRKSCKNTPCNKAILEAVEQQDLDVVQALLRQHSVQELDLNTPNSEGLVPLDIAIMTNNVPVARTLLKAGAKESPHFVSLESRELHLDRLVEDALVRRGELSAQLLSQDLSLERPETEKLLKAWEWRHKLYQRMRAGFQHARPPDTPTNVHLSITSSTSLTVTFQEPLCVNSAIVTRYKVEWSCCRDFTSLCGVIIIYNLSTLNCPITGLLTGKEYYIRVSAANMKGWGAPQATTPPFATPSNWKELAKKEVRQEEHIKALEQLLDVVRSAHQKYSTKENAKVQDCSRKQSVSRSLKHLFHSSNKFVKTLQRGVYIAAAFYCKDSILVSSEEQLPIVEIESSYSSTLNQDFLWFAKLSCSWEDVQLLRQTLSISMSSSSTLQVRHKMLIAAAQLQTLLCTQNLGQLHYEPIKDRQGNVLLVTVREFRSCSPFLNAKWIHISKFQNQRKSLSTPEEPSALDILFITIQDVLCYQRDSLQRLSPGLYLGYLKLSSSVDQIKVLVPQKFPNILCHTRVRENANVSRDEWEWLQRLSDCKDVNAMEHVPGPPAPLGLQLQGAVQALLKLINLPLRQARHMRLFTRDVLELGHDVSFLLLMPSADDVCMPPGQSTPYSLLPNILHLPLQMFELAHFCCYRELFMPLYCSLSMLLELDLLISQQALREAISDEEILSAKQRHQEVLDFVQKVDEIWQSRRWIMEVLQFARYKQPVGGLLIPGLLGSSEEPPQEKNDSTSSQMDYFPSPATSPEIQRRKGLNDSPTASDDEGCSEVFLPTDSDYDSSEALSPRDLDLVNSANEFGQWVSYRLSGSAPDVLQDHEVQSHLEDEFKESLSVSEQTNSEILTLEQTRMNFLEKRMHQKSSVFFTKKGNQRPSKPQPTWRFPRQHQWLRFHHDSHSLSLSDGVYTHVQEGSELLPETVTTGCRKASSGTLCGNKALSLSETGRICDEKPKANVQRILVEPCERSSSQEEPHCWSTENVRSQSPRAMVDSPSGMVLDTNSDILSSML